jgi:hypothetical protein
LQQFKEANSSLQVSLDEIRKNYDVKEKEGREAKIGREAAEKDV